MNNIYLVTQNVNTEYDTFDSMVVSAPDKETARWIHPWDTDVDIYKKATILRSEPHLIRESVKNLSVWCDPSKVKIKLIGRTNEPTGVILASFNRR